MARDSSILPRYNKLLVNVEDSTTARSGGLVTIPVVVHVVWNSPVQNISTTQIQSAIDVLNADYRRQNSDAWNTMDYSQYGTYPADCEIEFCLVAITRTYTTYTEFGYDPNAWGGMGDIAGVKNIAQGYGQGYLNIWTCEIQGSLLGYAVFPNTAPAEYEGVTVDYTSMGTTGVADPSYAGRVVTHEVGHWLGLFHITGNTQAQYIYDQFYNIYVYNCGDDYTSDTWAQHTLNSGCSWLVTNCTGSIFYPYNYQAMNQNFMDYSTGSCLNFFSEGQKQRIWYHINNYRWYLVSTPIPCNTAVTEESLLQGNFTYDNLLHTLSFNTAHPSDQHLLEIYDMSGKIVTSSDNPTLQSDRTFQFGLPELGAGAYLLIFYTDEGTYRNKLVVL